MAGNVLAGRLQYSLVSDDILPDITCSSTRAPDPEETSVCLMINRQILLLHN